MSCHYCIHPFGLVWCTKRPQGPDALRMDESRFLSSNFFYFRRWTSESIGPSNLNVAEPESRIPNPESVRSLPPTPNHQWREWRCEKKLSNHHQGKGRMEESLKCSRVDAERVFVGTFSTSVKLFSFSPSLSLSLSLWSAISNPFHCDVSRIHRYTMLCP